MQSKVSLSDLLTGRYSAIVIRNFVEKEYCNRIANRITDFSEYDYGNGKVKKVGVFLTSYLTRQAEYFREVQNVEKQFSLLFGEEEDPRRYVAALIGRLMPRKHVVVAHQDGTIYPHGILRIHENGDSTPLHRDVASFDAPGLYVGGFKHQVSATLHLQSAERGGELVIYNKTWKPYDEGFREIGFGYSRRVIDGYTKYAKIQAEAGDLVLINPIQYHEVLSVEGRRSRITLGMFVGLDQKHEEVVLWS